VIAIELIYHAQSRIAPFLIPSPQPSPGGRGRKEICSRRQYRNRFRSNERAYSQECIGCLPRVLGMLKIPGTWAAAGSIRMQNVALRPLTTSLRKL